MENLEVNINKRRGEIILTLTASPHNKSISRSRVKSATAKNILKDHGHLPGNLISSATLDNAEYSVDYNLTATWVFEDLSSVNKKNPVSAETTKTHTKKTKKKSRSNE